MAGPNFSAAFDLSSLRTPPPRSPSTATSAASGDVSFVVEVSEASFESAVLVQSQTVPVVVDFWAAWSEPSKQLSDALQLVTAEFAGRVVLARIDVDANQRIAQAAGVQAIPTVIAVVAGQVVPLFQGPVPQEQIRQFFTELLKVAAANGVSGVASGAIVESPGDESEGEVPEAPGDPRFDAAFDAIDRGDFAAAAAAYQSVLNETPADIDAQLGLAQAQLLVRTDGVDPIAARAAADAAPADVAAACLAADVDLLAGDVDAAFTRLVATVAVTAGADRDRARAHLVGLYAIVGEDPRVAVSRRALASALF